MSNTVLTSDAVLNLAEALTNMDGDAELLQEIVGIFMETAEAQLASIAEGIAANDPALVALQAHALKGGASNFCAAKFVASALNLELLAKTGSLEGANEGLERMRADYGEVAEVIAVINWQEVENSWQG